MARDNDDTPKGNRFFGMMNRFFGKKEDTSKDLTSSQTVTPQRAAASQQTTTSTQAEAQNTWGTMSPEARTDALRAAMRTPSALNREQSEVSGRMYGQMTPTSTPASGSANQDSRYRARGRSLGDENSGSPAPPPSSGSHFQSDKSAENRQSIRDQFVNQKGSEHKQEKEKTNDKDKGHEH